MGTSLHGEAEALGRFILGGPVEMEFVDRYVEAHGWLSFGDEPEQQAVVDFAVSHPKLLPCLDAAAALRMPGSLLHKKALLMTAILEASPRHADEFLPRTFGWLGLATLGTRVGLSTAVQLLIGLPLLAILGRRR